jgi:putative ABC transport system permease protein
VVLTVFGGTVGVIVSIALLSLIVQLVPLPNVFVMNPWAFVPAMGVSVATGVLFGVWPARRAAALSRIEALRYA